MKTVDFAIKDVKDVVSYDEYGNLYIDSSKLSWWQQDSICIPYQRLDEDTFFISKETCNKYNQYEIIAPENIAYDSSVRRPYYRMRGKPVTKEQAFDIIRKTDRFFCDISAISEHKDFVGSGHLDNWLIYRNHYPYGYGWVHTDGTIGLNNITYKYPELHEFIREGLHKLMCFPYLDLMIAITRWNEIPDEAYRNFNTAFYRNRLYEYEDYDEKFYEAVVLGICIRDKTIEILKPADAVEKYKEYASLYEKKREIYIPEYYQEHGIEQVDLPYLKKCIESYGLNADEELSKIPEYMWKKKGD